MTGTKSKDAIWLPHWSHRERPLATLSPMGQRLHNAATKLPQIAPKTDTEVSKNQSGKANSRSPMLSYMLFRTGPSAPFGSRLRLA